MTKRRPEHDPADAEATRLETLIEGADGGADEDDAYKDLGLERFRILRKLGEGGMGQVLLARQIEPVERLVAIKLIRNKVNNPSNLARFDIERQALAQMSHPAIGQVFDAGTTPAGHPYFVMEYIQGTRLDEFCNAERLTLRQRLELFVRVCHGVQHAHLKGIIHRDLKPANILVSLVDGTPMPKIIDFGIATAAADDAPRSTKRDVVGTPRYMSPEQFSLDRLVIDTRTDVYSLGVILYELLVERPPLDPRVFQTAQSTRMQEIMAHYQPLPSPSARLLEDTEHRDAVARSRRITLRQLHRRLRNDLDAVTLKALALEREQRYASPDELAGDLLNLLDHRPVSAVPSTTGYRLRRFARRHALGLGSASAVLLALVAGLTAATLGMLEAQRQFHIAEQRQLELEDVARFQQSMLEGIDAQAMGVGLIDGFRGQFEAGLARQADPELDIQDFNAVISLTNGPDLARQVLNRHVLDRAGTSIEEDFAGRPALQASLYDSLFSVNHSLGISEGLPELAEVVIQRLQESGQDDRLTLIKARYRLGSAWFDVGDPERSLDILQPLVEQAGQIETGADADELNIRIRNQIAINLVELGRTREAAQSIQETLELARDRLGEDHEQTLKITGNLGYVLARSGKIEDALEYFRLEAAQWRLKPGDQRGQLASSLINVGAALGAMGRLDEALDAHEEALNLMLQLHGRRHPDTLRVMNNKASTLTQLDRIEEAKGIHEETLRLRRDIMGNQHPLTLRSQLNLGSIYNRLERREEALAMVTDVFEQRRAQFGSDHIDTLSALEIMATITMGLGRHDAAAELLEQLVQRRGATLGPDHRLTVHARRLQDMNHSDPPDGDLEAIDNND